MINPQHVILFHYFRNFLKLSNEHRIDVAPLKGAHLLTGVYPPDFDRGVLADVDFLVKPADFHAVGELLEGLGFRRIRLHNREATAADFYETGYLLPIDDRRQILFEPHRQLIQPERHPIDLQALWDRSVASTFEAVPCRRLADDDHFLYAVIHETTHQFVDPGRTLDDLEMLLRYGGVSLEVVTGRARKWQCSRAVWLCLSLLHRRAPELEIAPFAPRIAPPKAVQSALRFLVPDEGGLRYADLSMRYRQALLWPWLLDGLKPALQFTKYYTGLRLRDLMQRYL